MTWFLGGLSLISLLLPALATKLKPFARYISFASVFLFILSIILNCFGYDSPDIPFLEIWTLLVFEGVLFWLLNENQNSPTGVLPSSSIPILSALVFLFCLNRLSKENAPLIIGLSFIFQSMISVKHKDWDYLFKKSIIGISIFVFIVLGYYVEDGFSLPLIIFTYWFLSELIPFGIENRNEENTVQPIANRIFLLSIVITQYDFRIPINVLISACLFLAVTGSISVFFSKNIKSVWKNFRRASEAILILTILVQNVRLMENGLIAILSLSFYSFLPLFLQRSNLSNLAKIIKPMAILLMAGFLGGPIDMILGDGILFSKLEGIGHLFLLFPVSFWILAFTLWVRLGKFKETQSKIDHLNYLAMASAIIMSVIISF